MKGITWKKGDIIKFGNYPQDSNDCKSPIEWLVLDVKENEALLISRYQWELAKLSPNEFYQFYTTGIYPLDISNKSVSPKPVKIASELGAE